MSDWNESARKRKEFRQSKSDPEVAKGRKGKNNKKYTHKLIVENFGWFGNNKCDFVFGKYRSKKAAEEALQQKTADTGLWGKYKMRIEEL